MNEKYEVGDLVRYENSEDSAQNGLFREGVGIISAIEIDDDNYYYISGGLVPFFDHELTLISKAKK